MSTLRTICRPGAPYTPSEATDVRRTWERHGFRPTTDYERMKRNGMPVRVLTFDEPEIKHGMERQR